jgi:hypothetical protein
MQNNISRPDAKQYTLRPDEKHYTFRFAEKTIYI